MTSTSARPTTAWACRLTYGQGCQQFKFAYYHMSSHLGDEFVLEQPWLPSFELVPRRVGVWAIRST